ncbi:MAG: repressor LexA [Candidatus Eisenbacteria bacterium]|nr:repressor LexA [Candidatus Latescibacterota bacterium]MBD3301433.1 repressor LexA [Candidatus Eisenbacteria bacterium]
MNARSAQYRRIVRREPGGEPAHCCPPDTTALRPGSPSRRSETVRTLTKRQREILDFILETIEKYGRFPSYREIGAHFGLTSPATVSQHLEALAAKGALHRRGRHYSPAEAVRRDQGIPVLGRVAAGSPITAVENIEERIQWNRLGGEHCFAVRVLGNSMVDEGIREGDLAIVEPCDEVRNGELIVAYVGEDQEATVKRYHRSRDVIELRPANRAYRPMRFSTADPHLRLAGRVVAILRRF